MHKHEISTNVDAPPANEPSGSEGASMIEKDSALDTEQCKDKKAL